MTPSSEFAPSAKQGLMADERMHHELAASLDHIADALSESLPLQAQTLRGQVVALRGGRKVPSHCFRDYYNLVDSILTDNKKDVEAFVEMIGASADRVSGMQFQHYGQPEAAALCTQLIEEGMEFGVVDPTTASDFESLVREGLALAKQAIPDLYDEVTAIVHEVLLAHAPEGAAFEFDGASHYQFWGLLMLNPKHHRTPIAVIEVLAHEAAHSLLFGLTIEEPLVLNPDEDLFASPLRVDPRPMDGIYHATFVSARMAWAMEALAKSDLLDAAQKEWALDAAAKDRENFASGLSVVDQHGILSQTGASILKGARDWINAA
ncbi:aKG-HExxH-type peptide beta-hydroxylase [Actibacterium pelagium]|uniref:HEXXH motif domain-containing protein n=1 Tax=Actibacterium pelagium TaxID=2029103 RepID=A0A917AFJ9_9RHOB|nr:HEXXH motif-containing putative peptide modification protein [Actibacterium pelagium]GGE49062.1 hypothetical protein GCM10011517_16170 [Actibacterium pelagium]